MYKRYRRNGDEDFRELERRAATGDEEDVQRLHQAKIRAGRIPAEIPSEGLWVNAYVNNLAKATLHVNSYEAIEAGEKFLLHYFNETPMRSGAREIFDIASQEMINEPSEHLQILVEEGSSFDFKEGVAIPRQPLREPWVGFYLVDEIDEIAEDEEEEEPEIDDLYRNWLNAYEVTRHYGSAAEGGDWYNFRQPIAILAIKPARIGDIRVRNLPNYLLEAEAFLRRFYEERAYGDIYSSRGGVELDISFEEDPGQYTEPYSYE